MTSEDMIYTNDYNISINDNDVAINVSWVNGVDITHKKSIFMSRETAIELCNDLATVFSKKE
jgi:hypothetical protein